MLIQSVSTLLPLAGIPNQGNPPVLVPCIRIRRATLSPSSKMSSMVRCTSGIAMRTPSLAWISASMGWPPPVCSVCCTRSGDRSSRTVSPSQEAQASSRRRTTSMASLTFSPFPFDRRGSYATPTSQGKAGRMSVPPVSRSGPPRLGLALRAEVGAAPADGHALDGGPAPPALLALAAVHLELPLELAGPAEQVHVGLVVERRAPVADGFLDHFLDGPVQPADLLRGQGVRHPVVAEARREQDLVRVDVPQARHELLVHEQRLQLRRPLGQELAPLQVQQEVLALPLDLGDLAGLQTGGELAADPALARLRVAADGS